MGTWYYFQNGQQVGPVEFSGLRTLAARGELTGDDQVWEDGTPAWISASEVPGLFQAQSRPSAVVAAPARKMPVRKKGPSPLVVAAVGVGVVIAAVCLWIIIQNRNSGTTPVVNSPPSVIDAKDDGVTRSSDTGDLATRLYKLGLQNLHGDGMPVNADKGSQLIQQSAQLGNPDAECAFARMCASGQGVKKKDEAKAVKYFTMAAEKDNVEAMNALASAYENGTGVAADPAAAKKWRDKAAATSAGGDHSSK